MASTGKKRGRPAVATTPASPQATTGRKRGRPPLSASPPAAEATTGRKRGRPPLSASPPAAEARSGKKTWKALRPVAEALDPFDEACNEIFTLLDRDESLTEGARGMLRESLPFALRPGKAERHKFQETLAETITKLFQGIESHEKDSVNTAETKLAEATSEGEGARATLAVAQEEAAKLLEASQAAEAVVKEAEQLLASAKTGVADAQKLQDNLKAKASGLLAQKTEREQLVNETWASLKEGLPGKEWRIRDKKIKDIVKVLRELTAEESLILSLPVALKDRSSGFFAGKCIELVDEILKKSVADMDEKIKVNESEAGEQATAVTAAEQNVEAAKATLDERQSQLIAAENTHLEASEKETAAAEAVKAIRKQSDKLTAELAAAKENHADVVRLIGQFEALVEYGAAVKEMTMSEAAPSEGQAQEAAPSEQPGKEVTTDASATADTAMEITPEAKDAGAGADAPAEVATEAAAEE